MFRKSEPKRRVDRMLDADAHGDEHFLGAVTIVPDLQRRSGTGDVEGVVRLPRKAHGLAQAAGSCSQEPGCGT